MALAYRRSIFSRTSSSDGVLPGAASELIDSRERAIVSCILACSSWLISLVRSASFCCRIIALFSTALRAWPAAPSAWSWSVFRSSMPCSAETSWVAKTWAVFSYSVAFASSLSARALSDRTSAWRADACNFSTSAICRDSFISSWRWLPMTAAACCTRAWCWRCASSIACWICTFGSAYSSILAPNSAIRYLQPLTNGFAIAVPLYGYTIAGRAAPVLMRAMASIVSGPCDSVTRHQG
jgi:hypothetical protein